MAKKMLNGYRIGGDIIDMVSPPEPVPAAEFQPSSFSNPSVTDVTEGSPPVGQTLKRAPASLDTNPHPIPAPQPAPTPEPSGPGPVSSSEAPDRTEGGADVHATADIGPGELSAAVTMWYRRVLREQTDARRWLAAVGIHDMHVVELLGVGYSDGRLAAVASDEQVRAVREAGLLDEGGREVLAGCLVVPCTGEDGRVSAWVGIPVDETDGEERYAGHGGLWNPTALEAYRGETVLLVARARTGLGLIGQGIVNVIGFAGRLGDEHIRLLRGGIVVTDEEAAELSPALERSGIGFGVARLDDNPGRETIIARLREAKPAGTLRRFWKDGDQWAVSRAAVSYRIVGIRERVGASIRVSLRMEAGGRRFVDHVDLYSSRSRASFTDAAGKALGLDPGEVEQDLYAILEHLEAEEAKRHEKPAGHVVVVEGEEREAGMAILTDPAILDRIERDMTALGYVGEAANKKLCYIAASSRKLGDPVSMVIVSQSAAGKSFLIDTVRKLMPPEDVVNLTSLSDQALQYFGDDGLMHKLLILGEAVHSEVVEHQIREMLSAQELSRLVVTKDARTGALSSRMISTNAVVSLMMSTTSRDMNPENASRCLLVHADESAEQTARIHAAQNRKYSLGAWEARVNDTPRIVRAHHAAQRLLEPVAIVNPFEHGFALPSNLMRSRRDNKQFNELVAAICFLRQYQKPRQSIPLTDGMTYIEVDETDIREASALMREAVLRSTYLELPESMVNLYEAIRTLCREMARLRGVQSVEVSFEQADVRKAVNWLGAESIKQYIRKLVGLEYLVVKAGGRQGSRMRYGLSADESLEELSGLARLGTGELGKSG